MVLVLAGSISKTNAFEWLTYIINDLELKDTLIDSEIYPNEVGNLEALLNEAKLRNLKDVNITRFANLGFPEDQVTITTRHSSKGLEFEVVILLGMEEEHFPSFYHLGNETALAEDQRLCYVYVSRAKTTCMLLRSRFLLSRQEEVLGEKNMQHPVTGSVCISDLATNKILLPRMLIH